MKQRIITGLIGGGGFLYLVFLGGLPYTILITVLALVGFYELLKMNKTKFYSLEGIIGFITVFLIILSQNPIKDFFTYIDTLSIILIAMILYLILIVAKKNKITFDHVSYYFLGSVYIGFGFSYMLHARFLESGFIITLFVLFTTWATDSGAYFIGKLFGKHKLWPEISPKKTIEGSLGGIIFAIIASVLTNYFGNLSNYAIIIGIAILIAVVGQLGDLVESALKRSKNVKDSGNFLPGHGGALDRFDSLLFIFLVLHVINIWYFF